MMGPIEVALREIFFPAIFREEEINTDFRKILGCSVMHVGLGMPEPRLSDESTYNTSKVDSEELVDSLLGGSTLNYIGHRACVRKASQTARQTNMSVELAESFKRQELAGGQDRNRLHRTTRNGAWISAVPHCLNGTGLSQEELQDNLRLRYGLMLQDIPATCDGCSTEFLIEHALS